MSRRLIDNTVVNRKIERTEEQYPFYYSFNSTLGITNPTNNASDLHASCSYSGSCRVKTRRHTPVVGLSLKSYQYQHASCSSGDNRRV